MSLRISLGSTDGTGENKSGVGRWIHVAQGTEGVISSISWRNISSISRPCAPSAMWQPVSTSGGDSQHHVVTSLLQELNSWPSEHTVQSCFLFAVVTLSRIMRWCCFIPPESILWAAFVLFGILSWISNYRAPAGYDHQSYGHPYIRMSSHSNIQFKSLTCVHTFIPVRDSTSFFSIRP